MDDTDLELNEPVSGTPAGDPPDPWARADDSPLDDGSEYLAVTEARLGDTAAPVGPGDVPGDETPVAPLAVMATSAAPPIEPMSYPGLAAADGRRRRRTAVAVIVAALAAGGAGMFVGTRIQSPADRAAARSAPVPSLITVGVDRRRLTSEIVLNGEVAYNEPVTVQLAGGVGIGPSDTAVVTEVREAGTALNEGDMIVEVTGRPVFVLQGDLPMYRRLVVGSEGPDVLQLEEALVRLGYPVEPVDTVFDAATATAVEQLYVDRGYAAEGPSAEQQADLVAAREAVTGAERAVVDARNALAEAQDPLPESQRLQLEQAVNEAREAVPNARAAADTTRVEQDQLVATARAARDTARTQRDAAVTVRDTAATPGAIDPDTGEPYTAERIAALDVAAAEAQEVYVAAEGQLVVAEQTRDTQVVAADAAIGDAEVQLRIAEAQYREATQAGDTTALEEAVTAAEAALTTVRADLVTLEAAAGTRISPGEIVFAPVLPSTLTESYVTLGSGVDGPIGMLATTETLVRARVARADAAVVPVGAEVDVEIRDAGITTTGTVLSIGEPVVPGEGEPGSPGGPGGGGGSSGRMEVVVAPSPGVDLAMYMWYGVRVRVQIDATDGEVLVVPVAALTVGPDEVSQVEVERTPATDDVAAVTDVVAVTVGLSADGLAEVSPVEAGALVEGDRVVIGVDTNTLPGTDGGDDDGGVTPGGGSTPGEQPPPGTDAGGDDGDGDDGSASPLGELLGWVSDPVEQRRQELAIEEAVAACMRQKGWEYTPVDWSAQSPGGEEMSDPEAFGAKYGYGVMYWYELYESGDGEGGGPEMPVDPNMEYVNSLTPDEQEAYQRDLYGEMVVFDEAASVGTAVPAMPSPEEQGCQGQARLEVVGEDPTNDPEIQRMLEDFWTRQQDDPALEAAVGDWVECFTPKLAEYGIETVPANIYDGYQIVDVEKYKALGAEVVPIANQAEMDEMYNSGENVVTSMIDENGSGYAVVAPGEPGAELPDLTGPQIDELAAMELDLWKADQACLDEVGYEDLIREQEQALVDELLAQFPQLG